MKLLTEFDGHPKVLAVGLAGAGLYARALAYCGKYETDGVVRSEWLAGVLAGAQASAKASAEQIAQLPQALVAVGLWQVHELGYEIVDFTALNKSRLEMQDLRENRANAGKKGGEARARAKAEANAKQTAPSNSSSNSEFDSWLEHYRETTGQTRVRGSKAARDQFAARRRDGFSLDELKDATVGCHGDEWLRSNGHDVPETILRAKNVQRYIKLAATAGEAGSKPRTPAEWDALAEQIEREEAA